MPVRNHPEQCWGIRAIGTLILPDRSTVITLLCRH